MNVHADTRLSLEYDKVVDAIAARASSTLGREVVVSTEPIDDDEQIERRLRTVLETMDLIAFDDPLTVARMPDVRTSLEDSARPGTILEIGELLNIAQILDGSSRLHSYVSKRRQKYPNLYDLASQLVLHPDLHKEIGRVFDPATETVRDNATRELRRLRHSLEQIRDAIREQAETVLQKLPDTVLQDRLLTIREGRYVIPVRESQKGRVEGIIHDQSATGQTVFIEPMASVQGGNRQRQLELAEHQEVVRILRRLSEQVADVRDEIRDNLDVLGRFDAVYAKASYARDVDATEPLFNNDGLFRLNGARHPILLHRMHSESREGDVVPLDITFGTEAYWTLILTGPNAGGKTVSLKTIGLLALMAHAGLPIPAQPKSEIPRLSGVFADIGDAQSIENDLSTFSSHAANLARICNEADGRSLVLLDEIGASTDPDQGSALAVALLTDLNERGTRTVATTHHGALKAFAHETDGIENGSMAFDAETLQPTFRLRLQVPGSSYAFEIARRYGLPDHIVDRAQELAGADVGRVEDLIQKLDDTYRHYQEELETAQRERHDAQTIQADYGRRLEQVRQRERDLRQNAQEEAKQILADANALVERTVQEIRQSKADREATRAARRGIEDARRALDRRIHRHQTVQDPVTVDPGDTVFIPRLNQTGVVLTESGSDRLMVEVGVLKVEVSPREIEVRQKSPESVSDKPSAIRANRDQDVGLDVDLRGLTFDEAADVVDRYIDDLLVAGIERAAIIHGKGTGALRQKIGDYLRNDPRIKVQRLGHQDEGGSGVTVVEIDLNTA